MNAEGSRGHAEETRGTWAVLMILYFTLLATLVAIYAYTFASWEIR